MTTKVLITMTTECILIIGLNLFLCTLYFPHAHLLNSVYFKYSKGINPCINMDLLENMY